MTGTSITSKGAALVFFLSTLIGAAGAAAQPELKIGVRVDAPPFSYLAEPDPEGRLTAESPVQPSGKVFTGYMVNICATVLEEMRKSRDFSVSWVPIEARDRFTALEEGRINILCDPATITQKRLAIPGVLVSPPVYLSGVGWAETTRDQWAGHWPCIGPVAGVVEGTTAPRSVRLIAENFGFGETFSPRVLAHPEVDKAVLDAQETESLDRCPIAISKITRNVGPLANYISKDAGASEPSAAYVVRSYPDHEALAKALCDGEIYYSVGDLEIVTLALKSYMDTNPDCPARSDPQVYSEERYGIFIHLSDQMNAAD